MKKMPLTSLIPTVCLTVALLAGSSVPARAAGEVMVREICAPTLDVFDAGFDEEGMTWVRGAGYVDKTGRLWAEPGRTASSPTGYIPVSKPA